MIRSLLLVPLALISCSASAPSGSEGKFAAKARALDGDTVAVDFRLLGVDAFERRQMCARAGSCWACGKAGQDVAARLLRSKTAEIRLTTSTTYGRPVATGTVDGDDLGERLIAAGLAVPEPQYLDHDRARARRYQAAFDKARVSRAGALAGSWIEPARWRRGERLACER